VIAKAMAALRGMREPAFVAANCRIVDENGRAVGLNRPTLDLVKLLGTPFDVEFPYNPSSYFYGKSLHTLVGPYDVADALTMDLDFVYRVLAVASTKHVDEIWGNFRFIPGTKTYETRDHTRSKVLAVRQRHLRRLPVRSRIEAHFWQSKVAYWKLANQVRRSLKISA
jgi:hypothetical protein